MARCAHAWCVRACVVVRFWTFWNHFFFWGSIASYFLFLVVYNVMAFGTPPFYYSAFVMFTRPTFWLLLALVPFACVIFDLTTMQCVSPACCACVCLCMCALRGLTTRCGLCRVPQLDPIHLPSARPGARRTIQAGHASGRGEGHTGSRH